jgi:hypothetical protein
VGAELGQVGALQGDDPGVGAQPPAELAGTGVDGVDAGRPGIEQGLGEAAGRRAQVERDSAGRIDPEDGQGAGELDRPPAGGEDGVSGWRRPRARGCAGWLRARR